MKKVSLAGLVLGGLLGVLAGLLSGSWIFWLGMGLAIGVVVGASTARRGELTRTGVGTQKTAS